VKRESAATTNTCEHRRDLDRFDGDGKLDMVVAHSPAGPEGSLSTAFPSRYRAGVWLAEASLACCRRSITMTAHGKFSVVPVPPA